MITVLRYGHRPGRDKRTTTHVGLVARAFGADRLLIVGKDSQSKKTIDDISSRWGGSFEVGFVGDWRKVLRDFKGTRVHLTMYGLPVDEVIGEIRSAGDLLVFVGAEKAPPEVYELCDFNVAVGSQPHSEISALAVFLDRLFSGQWREFTDAKLRVVPKARGKKVETF